MATQLATIRCSTDLNFRSKNSPRELFGFDPDVLIKKRTHVSQRPININKVNILRVLCNITKGSYVNGVASHVIHEFFPLAAPSFKIVETPNNPIYLPINRSYVDNITLSIVDQDGDPIDFRGEAISIRLHLRRESS